MPPEHPLVEAIKNGDKEAAIQVLSEDPGSAYSKSEDGVSALMIAGYYQQPEIAQSILATRGGTDADILEASTLGMSDRVKALSDDGQNPNEVWSADGWNPLQLACYFGKEDAALELLKCGADIHSRSKNPLGVQPIHAALAGAHNRLAALLLDKGASPTEATSSGWTPLHYVSAMGDEEMVRLLLSMGAHRDAVTSDGKKAADLAEEKGYVNIVELLRPPD